MPAYEGLPGLARAGDATQAIGMAAIRGKELLKAEGRVTGTLATAFLEELQGDDPRYFLTVATPQHLAVHSFYVDVAPHLRRRKPRILPVPPVERRLAKPRSVPHARRLAFAPKRKS
ncbi:hypothetical protein [Sphingomonas phyllosphaerae]|uniref:hypothetical protein n=1 Tax=Sphingomonas phyllosphaerae TaxID=257003 RepID=UPI000413945D|nr:hypothetical protein [Sphingomonas phyllosphaerae]